MIIFLPKNLKVKLDVYLLKNNKSGNFKEIKLFSNKFFLLVDYYKKDFLEYLKENIESNKMRGLRQITLKRINNIDDVYYFYGIDELSDGNMYHEIVFKGKNISYKIYISLEKENFMSEHDLIAKKVLFSVMLK